MYRIGYAAHISPRIWWCTASPSTGLVRGHSERTPRLRRTPNSVGYPYQIRRVGGVPRRGLQRPVNEPHQPTESLHAPTCDGNDCDYVGR